MKSESQLAFESKTESPIWLISDQTFQSHAEFHIKPHFFVDADQGVHVIQIDEEFDFHHFQMDEGWGLYPVLKGNRAAARRQLFEYIYRAQLPILTIHIEPISEEVGQHEKGTRSRFGKILSPHRIRQFSSAEELMIYVQNKLSFYAVARKSGDHLNKKNDAKSTNPGFTWAEIKSELDLLEQEGKCMVERGPFKLFLTKFSQ